jgi:YnbE-like lipoprotein
MPRRRTHVDQALWSVKAATRLLYDTPTTGSCSVHMAWRSIGDWLVQISSEPAYNRRTNVVASHSWLDKLRATASFAVIAVVLAACQPTVKVEAPDKPIVINLNIKIEQEVRVKVDKEVEDLLKKQPDLF